MLRSIHDEPQPTPTLPRHKKMNEEYTLTSRAGFEPLDWVTLGHDKITALAIDGDRRPVQVMRLRDRNR